MAAAARGPDWSVLGLGAVAAVVRGHGWSLLGSGAMAASVRDLGWSLLGSGAVAVVVRDFGWGLPGSGVMSAFACGLSRQLVAAGGEGHRRAYQSERPVCWCPVDPVAVSVAFWLSIVVCRRGGGVIRCVMVVV